MKMKKNNFSRMTYILSGILVFIILLNLTVMFITMRNLTKSSAERSADQFRSDVTRISDSLGGIQSMMLAELSSDNELDQLLEEKGNRNLKISEYATIKRLNAMMSDWSGDLGYNVQYAIYLPSNQIEMNSCVQGEEFMVWRSIRKELYQDIAALRYKSGWQIMKLNGENYLVSIIQKNSICCICYINMEDLLHYLQNSVYGKNYYFAAEENGIAAVGGEKLEADRLKVSETGIGYRILGRQFMISRAKLQQHISLMLVARDYNTEAGVFRVQIYMWITLAVAVFIAVLFIWTIYRTILYPIMKFNEDVESLKHDETYNLEMHYRMKELENAGDLIHDMVSRIKKLRIDIYEKTLEQQKTRMDFLSLQIEPHFYLNCLNNIISMAQMRQYSDIQKFAGCVSVYLRYIFKSSEEMVSVREELYHIEKYLEIQKMRYQNGFDYQICVDERAMKGKIPPLLLQTFVENSLKYTVNWEDEIKISITGVCDGKKVQLCVADTGEGFPPEILKTLQNGGDISQGNSHIGIMNALARVAMIFGEEGKIRFENIQGRGAAVSVEIPFLEWNDAGKEQAVFMEKEETL